MKFTFVLICLVPFLNGCSNVFKIEYKNDLNKSFTKGELSPLVNESNVVIVDLLKSKIDTLNKNEYSEPNVGITLVTEDSIKEQHVNANYDIWFCSKTISHDSTIINISVPFGNQTITHYIKKNIVSTYFKEFYKDRSVLKATIKGIANSSLTVKAQVINFVLNERPDSKNPLFGESEIITAPFYVEDARFKSGFILKRYHLFYKFTISN